MRRFVVVLAVLGAVLAGCGTDGDPAPSAERSVDDADIAGGPDETPDRVDVLVAASAEWQCDRQRFAFDSLADVDDLLREILERHGVSPADYAGFEADMADDRELRARVLAAFEADCPS